jgi:hypothetical protein
MSTRTIRISRFRPDVLVEVASPIRLADCRAVERRVALAMRSQPRELHVDCSRALRPTFDLLDCLLRLKVIAIRHGRGFALLAPSDGLLHLIFDCGLHDVLMPHPAGQ